MSIKQIKIPAILLLMSLSTGIYAQQNWASEVVDYAFGTSQIFGQDSAYFPSNVLGGIGEMVGPMTPAGTPEEVVSIGKGGFIVLGFDQPIINENGPDFTVFENAFEFPGGIFDEWMIVSVSVNGVDWVTFPHDTLTGEGMAGRTPTAAIGVNYADPLESGGDSFELDSVGLDTILYVRVDDATQYQGPDRLSADLDAIVGLHPMNSTKIDNELPIGFEVEKQEGQWSFRTRRITRLKLLAMNGHILQERWLEPGQAWNVSTDALPAGAYIWSIQDRQGNYAYKWMR